MQTVANPKVDRVAQQSGYRGRVRSGCLTCRSRKVKCDERRPNCDNCLRLKRSCVYKPRRERTSAKALQEDITKSPEVVHTARTSITKDSHQVSLTPPTSTSEPQHDQHDQQDGAIDEDLSSLDSTNSQEPTHHQPLYLDDSIAYVNARLGDTLHNGSATAISPRDANLDDSPAAMISRDIELTTTMDILAAGEISEQRLFTFFVETVDCPTITVYDALNWQKMKLEVVTLGISHRAIASAITAVSMLYKALLFGLPVSKALTLYQFAKISCKEQLEDETQDFDRILVASFLLCLFEFLHYEMIPTLRTPEDVFIKRLESWAHQDRSHSLLARRITIWLRLLYAATIRGGGKGLISEKVYSLLPAYNSAIGNLPSPGDCHADTPTHLYEMLSGPLFDFYQQLQALSAEIAQSTHYHRSRCTGTDQEEVVERMAVIRARLHQLWDSRSTTQRQTPQDLRSHLAPKVADPIIALIGICAAAYHAEFVEMGRVLGDPIHKATESKQAMQQIRDVVDGDWNAYDGFKLKGAYLRPLFLYAIECMDREGSAWAVERLQHVKSAAARSDFFAAFARELAGAQLSKERRVTSKYFCIWQFGVPPPYL